MAAMAAMATVGPFEGGGFVTFEHRHPGIVGAILRAVWDAFYILEDLGA